MEIRFQENPSTQDYELHIRSGKTVDIYTCPFSYMPTKKFNPKLKSIKDIVTSEYPYIYEYIFINSIGESIVIHEDSCLKHIEKQIKALENE